MSLEIEIRNYDKFTDEDFLYSTWMKAHKNSSLGRGVPLPIYNIGQRRRINRILANPDTSVLVATNPEEPSVIYGYSVLQKNILHFLYVKGQFRKLGIAKALIADLGEDEVFFTHKSADIWVEKLVKTDPTYLKWVYNPYLLEG